MNKFLLQMPLSKVMTPEGVITPSFSKDLLDEFGEITIRQMGNLLVVEKPLPRIKSTVRFIVRDHNGDIVREHEETNTICDLGHAWLADAASVRVEEPMGWMSFGDTSGGKTSASTTLENELARRLCSLEHLTGASDDDVRYTSTLEAGVGTTTLKESGIHNNEVGGTMHAYTEYSQVKAIAESMEIVWDITY